MGKSLEASKVRKSVTRREFLKASLLSVGALSAATRCRPAPSTHAPRRPNLIYIFSDQQRSMSWSGGGNPDIYSANFERLASRGVNFRNCISNTPVCVPYRHSLLTGQYARGPLLLHNWANPRVTAALPSWPRSLRDVGYRTGYVGKLHLDYVFPAPEDRRYGYDWWVESTNYTVRYHTMYHSPHTRDHRKGDLT